MDSPLYSFVLFYLLGFSVTCAVPGPPVAFLARNIETYSGTFGSRITFKQVDHNLGDAFDDSTGVFTAPVTGLYLISYEFLPHNDCVNRNRLCARLQVNNYPIHTSCSARSWTGHDTLLGSGGSALNMKLSSGDEVWLTFADSCNIMFGNSVNGHNFFSGVLLATLWD